MKLTFVVLAWVSLLAVACAQVLVLDGAAPERVFNGIGGLSGGGATSRFLPSYEEPYISQILDYLFKPNFAASLQILKVEIGGDCQTTEGTESSHMHNRDDLNYERGYEWWLMTEAKQRNPDILLYGLSWGVPGWIGNGNYWSQDNIDYHIKWVQGAKSVYDLDIDFIGIWNERGYTIEWIIQLREALDANGFNNTKIVAHDAGFDIVSDMEANRTLYNAVDVVGVHYPGTTSPTNAQQLGTPLWASEDYSTYSDSTGGGCWGRILNENYVNGYMTATISWNLVASYYNNLPYAGDGLMWATSPWSGHYDVQSPIWVTAHTTQFTQPGWWYLAHGKGVGALPSGGSYVTLIPPSKSGDFTLVIETFTHDHSVCIRPGLPPYNVSAQTVTFSLQGGLATNKPLYVWYTHLEQNNNNTYFEQVQVITPVNGQFTLSLDLDSVVTVSTLTGQKKGSYPPPPAELNFPSQYEDSFNGYALNSEANYFMDQTGVWEIAKGQTTNVMRQVVTILPIVWCGESNRPISLVGDYSNAGVTVKVDALIENSGSVGVGVRVGGGGCGDNYANGYFFSVDQSGNWNLSAGYKSLGSGNTKFSANQFYTLQLTANDTQISAFINGNLIASKSDSTYSQGFSSIGTGWNYAQFDNFFLEVLYPNCGSGNHIEVVECNTSNYNQIWSLEGDGTLKLVHLDLCLEVNGTDPNSNSPAVRTAACNPASASQVWKFDGLHILSALNADCLDIDGGNAADCADVEVYTCNGGSNQEWTISGNGLIITNMDNLCLSAAA